MSGRMPAHLLVSALVRRVQAAGGFAYVLQRGDADAGAILVECSDKGQRQMLLEQARDMAGRAHWREMPLHQDEAAHAEMLAKRRRADPDIWIIELDIADAGRFAAEILSEA